LAGSVRGRTFAGVQSAQPLSDRELQVLDIARLGHTNAEIAARLGVTVHTVKFHLASVYRKLGAVNRTDAIIRWLSRGPGLPGNGMERD
jgi:DNA-binding CsgD family transcriptional regulator